MPSAPEAAEEVDSCRLCGGSLKVGLVPHGGDPADMVPEDCPLCVRRASEEDRRDRAEAAGDVLINAGQLARRLGVGVDHVRDQTDDGGLPVIQFGRRKQYHWPTVLAKLLAGSK